MNVKISELPASSPLNGTEQIPIIQSANTVQTTVQDIVDFAGTLATLQDVLDAGNTANAGIVLNDNINNDVSIDPFQVVVTEQSSGEYVQLLPSEIVFSNGTDPINVISPFHTAARTINLPNASGTIAVSVNGKSTNTNGNITTTLQDVTTANNITSQSMLITGSAKGDLILDGNDPVGSQPAVRIRNASYTDNHLMVLSGSIFFNSGQQLEVKTPVLDGNYTLTYPKATGTLAAISDIAGFVLPTNTPSNPLTGSIYFDSSSAQLKVWNGSWVSIS